MSVTGKKSRVLLLMHTKLLRKFWNEFRYSGVVAWCSRIHVCSAGCSGSTCNPITLEAEFWNGEGSIPVGVGPSIVGWI